MHSCREYIAGERAQRFCCTACAARCDLETQTPKPLLPLDIRLRILGSQMAGTFRPAAHSRDPLGSARVAARTVARSLNYASTSGSRSTLEKDPKWLADQCSGCHAYFVTPVRRTARTRLRFVLLLLFWLPGFDAFQF